MKKTEVSFDINTVPQAIQPYLAKATLYDSSCSETARTLFVQGETETYLKIAGKGTLEREYEMTRFLNGHKVAPKVIAYESDTASDYLLTEAVAGEDGTAAVHIEQPGKLAAAFGQYLRLLHSIPIKGCPYKNRTFELLDEHRSKENCREVIRKLEFAAIDNVIIHGDYCLPNIVMDRFTFKGFIDLGYGGIGDRHYDLYWGIWTLGFNLKTDSYTDTFLDAYGRKDVDLEILANFTRFMELSD